MKGSSLWKTKTDRCRASDRAIDRSTPTPTLDDGGASAARAMLRRCARAVVATATTTTRVEGRTIGTSATTRAKGAAKATKGKGKGARERLSDDDATAVDALGDGGGERGGTDG